MSVVSRPSIVAVHSARAQKVERERLTIGAIAGQPGLHTRNVEALVAARRHLSRYVPSVLPETAGAATSRRCSR